MWPVAACPGSTPRLLCRLPQPHQSIVQAATTTPIRPGAGGLDGHEVASGSNGRHRRSCWGASAAVSHLAPGGAASGGRGWSRWREFRPIFSGSREPPAFVWLDC